MTLLLKLQIVAISSVVLSRVLRDYLYSMMVVCVMLMVRLFNVCMVVMV